MKIIISNNSEKYIEFRRLSVGDVYESVMSPGILCMKTVTHHDSNAVRLDNGDVLSVQPLCSVIRISGSFVED